MNLWQTGLGAIALSLFLVACSAAHLDQIGDQASNQARDQARDQAINQSAAATISADRLITQIEADQAPLILDVRTPAEFADGHIPGAINVPHRALADQLDTLAIAPGQTVVVYCEQGVRAAIAAEILAKVGMTNVLHLAGDMDGWRQAGLPIEYVE